jgi:hypothetical protein
MPRSPDPHLGLATIYAYNSPDLDGFSQAIRDAEARGYTSGRRVRIWTGDLHLTLGDRARAEAKRLNGAERIEQLQLAADDYRKCIASFEGVRIFNSEANQRLCRRRLAEVTSALPAPPEPTLDLPAILDSVLREL